METQTDFSLRIYNAALTIVPRNIALLMVAQSKHETKNFTSDVFKNDTNGFGYKYYPGSKYQLQAGRKSPEGDHYASYDSIEQSAKEVAAWVTRHIPNYKNITTPLEYATALKKAGYYGDPLAVYANGVTNYFNPNLGNV